LYKLENHVLPKEASVRGFALLTVLSWFI